MTQAAPLPRHPACAATFAAIAEALAPPPAPLSVAERIEAAEFAVRAEVISVERRPEPGARGNCLVECRIVAVAKGDIERGAIVTLQMPSFTAGDGLPGCDFSIPSERLVHGARFDAAFHRGLVGFTMVNHSYRSADEAPAQAIGISTRLGPSRLVAALIAAVTSLGLAARDAGTPSATASA